MKIHGVERDVVDGMKPSGYADPSAGKLVQMKIHDFEVDDVENVQGMKSAEKLNNSSILLFFCTIAARIT